MFLLPGVDGKNFIPGQTYKRRLFPTWIAQIMRLPSLACLLQDIESFRIIRLSPAFNFIYGTKTAQTHIVIIQATVAHTGRFNNIFGISHAENTLYTLHLTSPSLCTTGTKVCMKQP
jgi:hypothetical protein